MTILDELKEWLINNITKTTNDFNITHYNDLTKLVVGTRLTTYDLIKDKIEELEAKEAENHE